MKRDHFGSAQRFAPDSKQVWCVLLDVLELAGVHVLCRVSGESHVHVAQLQEKLLEEKDRYLRQREAWKRKILRLQRFEQKHPLED